MTPKLKVLTKAPFVESVKGTEWVLMAKEVKPTDYVNYNDSSPASVMLVPPNTMVEGIIVEVVTAFNGVIPSIALGVTGTTNRHVSTNDVDLTTVGFTSVPGVYNYTAAATLIATLVAGGSTTGKLRFWITYRSRTDQAGL